MTKIGPDSPTEPSRAGSGREDRPMPTGADVLNTDQLSDADCMRVEDAVWEFEDAWNASFRAWISLHG